MLIKKHMKRISYVITMCLLLSSLLANYAYAVNFTYWYANRDLDLGRLVMYQTKSYYSYKNCSNNSATNTQLINEIATATSSWKSGLGITMSANSSNTSTSNAYVVWCGLSADLAAQGATLKDGQAGYTYIDGRYTSVGTSSCSEGTVTVCKYTSTIPVYVKTDNGGTANIIAHEIGHALGWYGHSNSNSLLMYYSPTSRTTPTTSDITHIKQVYDAYR